MREPMVPAPRTATRRSGLIVGSVSLREGPVAARILALLVGPHKIATTFHRSGLAVVWTGDQDLAEGYWDQLADAGLTMAPLERA